MSFFALREIESRPDRARKFWEVLASQFSGLDPNDHYQKVLAHSHLSHFRLGVLSYINRDAGQNGNTVIFYVPEKTTDADLTCSLCPKGTPDEDMVAFFGVRSVWDFLDDYFGLTKVEPEFPRTIHRRYRNAFLYGDFPLSEIDDFAVMMMRAAITILQRGDRFHDGKTYIGFYPHWNELSIESLENGLHQPEVISSTFF